MIRARTCNIEPDKIFFRKITASSTCVFFPLLRLNTRNNATYRTKSFQIVQINSLNFSSIEVLKHRLGYIVNII